MSDSKFVKANEKIAEGVTSGFKKIEDGVVGGYKKVEDGVVGAYKKVEDAFVDKFLTREGETVEDAKKRIDEEQAAREEADREAAEKRAAEQQARVGAGSDIGHASVEASLERTRASVEASKNMCKQ